MLDRRFCPRIRTFLLQSQTPRRLTRTGPRLSSFRFVAGKTVHNLHSRIQIPYISPHPPQTLAAQFKRPYRNCPEPSTRTQPASCSRGSPDRVLTFAGTNPQWTPTSDLPVIRPLVGDQLHPNLIWPLRTSSLCGKESEDLAHHALALIRIKEKLSMRRSFQKDQLLWFRSFFVFRANSRKPWSIAACVIAGDDEQRRAL